MVAATVNTAAAGQAVAAWFEFLAFGQRVVAHIVQEVPAYSLQLHTWFVVAAAAAGTIVDYTSAVAAAVVALHKSAIT